MKSVVSRFRLTPFGVVLVTSCTQGTLNRSAADVLSSVILAGTPSGSTSTTVSSARVINTAEDYLGVPYRWGRTSPETGFDCSGHVRYVYRRQGIRPPRTSREHADAGAAVSPRTRQPHPGDIVRFHESRHP